MLPLDSDRWATFDTFGDDPKEIPASIVRLQREAGTPSVEEGAWGTVRDFFYCQNRIKEPTAYAIIPHIVPLVRLMTSHGRLQAVIDTGTAERARGGRPIPPELFPELYAQAIRDCLAEALALVPTITKPEEFQYLMSAIACLSGQGPLGDVLFQNTVEGNCETCGAVVYLEAVHVRRQLAGRGDREAE